ncbi:TPA: intracellular multiplication protein IcmW [Legionella pneumophila]|uniref:Type 4 adapter protein IcmW n=4 Tax=Legionella pneumophila TaxID=446 RepID=ICMW_LEGPH|nr:type IVB secretion system protein IcmW [Legionella pneumophila]Q5ZS31.1 RecName: Full=Type 4 adapter protein IcmW; AltName: Full=Intracellular multiplication protein W; AltName: Full=Secretion adapter protein IcmW [Legionella pneumophila subsp. pneumophila str. Philadelphia 1]5XNB_C Chain C, IcmW [Legionella pneumophila]5XNB_F Chain F, IcmW [Legionella pneumophila]5XNB_I Chain I, IcmW [Legionella pneumophila]5XNB_L Chain L, IcmW [Legionella pneumophila]5XNB_O Chain O, IcmW [Legionella pneu
MPDLSHEASAKYWFEYLDPMIYRVITFMESVENWTLDGNPELEEAMKQLGQELDDIEKIDLGLLAEEDKFIRIVGNIKSGRGLRLLQAIDTVHPGSASRVLIHAEETSLSSSDPAGFFLKRNIVFERLRLLSRVFCQYRLKLVLRALEGDE